MKGYHGIRTSHDDEPATKVLAVFGAVVGGIGLIALSALMNGYVLSVLWGWFVAGYFGLKVLTIPAAYGLGLIVSFLTYRSNLKTEERSVWVNVSLVFFVPLFYLFMGWIVHMFM